MKIKTCEHNINLKGLYLFTKTEIKAFKLGINLYLSLYPKQSKAETNKLQSIINHNLNTSTLSRSHIINPKGKFKIHTVSKITFSEEVTILGSKNIITPCKISNNIRKLLQFY